MSELLEYLVEVRVVAEQIPLHRRNLNAVGETMKHGILELLSEKYCSHGPGELLEVFRLVTEAAEPNILLLEFLH